MSDDATRVIVVGDGPGGLSAALFLAKNGLDAVVYGQDATAMHYAQLHNYLGAPDTGGTAFQGLARRQVSDQGADVRDDEVTAVTREDAGFVVTTAGGASERADYLILAGGKPMGRLAQQLGAEVAGAGVVVDREQRTSVDRCYAVGRIARPDRSQAIISAGAGAVAALDILSREAGRDVTDWDSPPKE